MQIKTSGRLRVGAMLLVAGSLVGCIDRQEAPPLAGPSGAAQALTMSASPDMVAHNGSAQSVVTVTMIDADGKPLSGHRVALGASTGALSHVEVLTGSDGTVPFIVTAPALSTPASRIVVFATPFGTNADNALTRTISIDLTGPPNTTAPSPSITSAPAAPEPGQNVAFDASATLDEGSACNQRCTYTWSFGDGASSNGIAVTHGYDSPGTFVVGLTVVDNTGTAAGTRTFITVVPSTVVTP